MFLRHLSRILPPALLLGCPFPRSPPPPPPSELCPHPFAQLAEGLNIPDIAIKGINTCLDSTLQANILNQKIADVTAEGCISQEKTIDDTAKQALIDGLARQTFSEELLRSWEKCVQKKVYGEVVTDRPIETITTGKTEARIYLVAPDLDVHIRNSPDKSKFDAWAASLFQARYDAFATAFSHVEVVDSAVEACNKAKGDPKAFPIWGRYFYSDDGSGTAKETNGYINCWTKVACTQSDLYYKAAEGGACSPSDIMKSL